MATISKPFLRFAMIWVMVQILFFSLLISLVLLEPRLFKCPDIYQNACTTSQCSSKDADKRSLHFCDEWPYWAGGWGSWDEEDESYSCINSTDRYCSVWSTQEIKSEKNSTGMCYCIDVDIHSNETDIIPSPNYCSFWICTELQVFTNCKEEPYTSQETCIDLLDEEYNECHCLNASLNDQYCIEWQCLQFPSETANYICHSDVNGNYCTDWGGDIESEWEFELLDCTCDTADNSSNYCVGWKCVAKEMTKHYSSGDKYAYFHALFWPLFCACILGGSCASGTKNAGATIVMVTIVFCGVGVMSGGVGFLMIWLMIFGIPTLVICCGFLCSTIEEMQYERQIRTSTEKKNKHNGSTSAIDQLVDP